MKKDYEAYLKRPTPGQNIIKMGIPDRKFKFIKRYQTESTTIKTHFKEYCF